MTAAQEMRDQIVVKKNITRYELRINGTTHDMSNSYKEIKKEFDKSHARLVEFYSMSAGVKHLIDKKQTLFGDRTVWEELKKAV